MNGNSVERSVRRGIRYDDVLMLVQIEEAISTRVREIETAHKGWPCREGCDACCRSLAAEPRVSAAEWDRIAAALGAMPQGMAEELRVGIRGMSDASRPVTCGLLDRETGACRVYAARPLICRAYGFYAERGLVLGCGQIERVAEESRDIVWGNHAALEEQLRVLGPARPLSQWLAEAED